MSTIYIESVVLPVIPAILGGYCIYVAVRKGPVLKLEAGNGKHKMRLRSVYRNNQALELEKLLRAQLGAKFSLGSGAV